MGESSARIIFIHIIPNAVSQIIVNVTLQLGTAILIASSLSFLGLGVTPPDPEWGSMLSQAREVLRSYPMQNKTFYVNALAYTGQNCLQEYVFHYLSEMFGQRLLSLMPSATERDCQFAGNFLSGAMMGLLLPWVRNGMPPLNQADLDHGLRTLCSCNLAVLLGYGIDPSALVL